MFAVSAAEARLGALPPARPLRPIRIGLRLPLDGSRVGCHRIGRGRQGLLRSFRRRRRRVMLDRIGADIAVGGRTGDRLLDGRSRDGGRRFLARRFDRAGAGRAPAASGRAGLLARGRLRLGRGLGRLGRGGAARAAATRRGLGCLLDRRSRLALRRPRSLAPLSRYRRSRRRRAGSRRSTWRRDPQRWVRLARRADRRRSRPSSPCRRRRAAERRPTRRPPHRDPAHAAADGACACARLRRRRTPPDRCPRPRPPRRRLPRPPPLPRRPRIRRSARSNRRGRGRGAGPAREPASRHHRARSRDRPCRSRSDPTRTAIETPKRCSSSISFRRFWFST